MQEHIQITLIVSLTLMWCLIGLISIVALVVDSLFDNFEVVGILVRTAGALIWLTVASALGVVVWICIGVLIAIWA